MDAFLRWFEQVDRLVTFVLKWLCIALFVVLTLLLSANILVRFFPIMSLHWFDEIVEMVFAALVFYGAAMLWAVHGHFSVGDWISPRLPGQRAAHAYRLAVELLALGFLGVLFVYSLELTLRAEDVTNALQLPKSLLYCSMPIAAAIMLAYSAKRVLLEVRGVLGSGR
jgi:TRAP-type C4-dicarboxylate transport system permease small subunit